MGKVSFEVEVPPPFRLDLTVWALRRRPHNTIDLWDGTTYQRVLAVDSAPVLVSARQVRPNRPAPASTVLRVVVSRRGADPDEAEATEVRRILEAMLGLGIDLSRFYKLTARDERLANLAERFRGLRPPRFASVFEALVNAVACQQLSLTVGIHLLDRLAGAFGPEVKLRGAPPGFPVPGQLASTEPTDLRRLGFSRAKASSIIEVARRVASGDLDLEALARTDEKTARTVLLSLPGIGRWSAEYVLLRGLGRLGTLPGDDVGARNSLRRYFELPGKVGYEEIASLARRWWPFGGIVYFHLLLEGLARDGHLSNSMTWREGSGQAPSATQRGERPATE
ncbi:DNA-3-methyladenine glycosylase family protein [Aciditerrimonas ferrireducens]|uniref:DNA-3-methyladenine glycosylase II n=1 Tax=Aciditerrimonas ferrireducens TaxID=667306 RepID=A0ABV6BZG9_9ACTN